MIKTISVNFSRQTGKIKAMNAINNAPILGANDRMFHYLSEAKIPYSRLHDTGGVYGQNRFVDIGNIFRDWDADEYDEASYDFAFTDWLLLSLQKQGVEVFYRLGATIENAQKIKAYRIFPPKDNKKWAVICEHIIRHYNEGWANGFNMGIKYWEIWNEPDNYPDIEDNNMWKGTFEQYMELYKTTALHLKECFGDTIKVGGYASCGFYSLIDNYENVANSSERTDYFIECFHKFMKKMSAENVPVEFFSWHSYSDVSANVIYARYVREELDKYGYTQTESNLNEWNPGPALRGTLKDSANVASNMLALQKEPLDMLMYYDGQVNGSYQGLFNPITFTPFKTYYVFKMFSELVELGESVETTESEKHLYSVAAYNGKSAAIMITNLGEDCELDITADKRLSGCKVTRLNENENADNETDANSLDCIKIGQYETVLIKTETK